MKVKVHMRSTPGIYEQYDGAIIIDIPARDFRRPDEIKRLAVKRLQQTAFPDRSSDMWFVEGYEITN